METKDIRSYFREATSKVRAGDRHKPACITRSVTKINELVWPKPPLPDFELAKGCERIRITNQIVRRVKGWKAHNVTTA